MAEQKFGATGQYPKGKLNPYDEGELSMGVAHDSVGNVHFNFGKEIAWFALPQEQAINFAKLILKHAGVKKIEITL